MDRVIFKILTPQADAQLSADGALTPSGVDAQDGYVHFSTAAQLTETLDLHYQGHGDLVILAVDGGTHPDMRWEAARSGDLFPHLYATLTHAMVIDRLPLNAARDGLADWLKGVAA